jgi:hypothetical protein
MLLSEGIDARMPVTGNIVARVSTDARAHMFQATCMLRGSKPLSHSPCRAMWNATQVQPKAASMLTHANYIMYMQAAWYAWTDNWHRGM